MNIESLINRIADTPNRISRTVDGWSEAELRQRPAPDGWSAADVLAHLRSADDILTPRVYMMLVRDNPYFAVTKADGTFEIANVPAGVPLEFRVWQEKSKFLQKVTVNGKPETWNKGRIKTTLQPDQALVLDVAVDAAAFSK